MESQAGGQADAPAVYLLFEAGKRPSAAAIHAFVEAWGTVLISHDPAEPSSPDKNLADPAFPDKLREAAGAGLAERWIELLYEGLTFDLSGLTPGPACVQAPIAHAFDWRDGQPLDRFEAIRLGASPHLRGGERAQPVLRAMIRLARDMTLSFGSLAALVWPPSASLIGRRFFESTASAWLDGGPFPALGLTAFDETADGGLQTAGLALWTGQELYIAPGLAHDKVAATRLGVRLVNHLVMLGGIARDERVTALDGTRLVMVPSAGGRLVRVQRE